MFIFCNGLDVSYLSCTSPSGHSPDLEVLTGSKPVNPIGSSTWLSKGRCYVTANRKKGYSELPKLTIIVISFDLYVHFLEFRIADVSFLKVIVKQIVFKTVVLVEKIF